jgi:hypothetical protein
MNNKHDEDVVVENNNQKTGVWVEYLSEELCMQILSFVPPLEILRSVTNVSKSFHAIVYPPSYWMFHAKALLQNIHRRRRQNNSNLIMVGDDDDGDTTFSCLDHDVELNRHQWQRLCVFLAAPSSSSEEDVQKHPNLPAGLYYGSRLVNRVGAESIRRYRYYEDDQNFIDQGDYHRRRVCLASSTEHPTELLENVLGNNHRHNDNINIIVNDIIPNLGLFALRQQHTTGFHHQTQKWWSSQPSPTQESSDTILFTTNCPLALLSDLKWRPLLDPFTRRQVYTWRYAIVKAYRLPLSKLDPHPDQAKAGFPCSVEALPDGVDGNEEEEEDMADDMDDLLGLQSAHQGRTSIQRLLEGQRPVFESSPLPYTLLLPTNPHNMPTIIQQGSIPWQHLIFPPALLANVVTITLVGKDSRQFSHSGYYACVEQVMLEGIPLLKGVYESEFAQRASNGFAQPQQQQQPGL